eukprot:NODE_7_length_48057_cov_0.322240.p16 type:complete len:272 gc:universal NODE_7_length_48057_cov_0.322240:1682-2497(+)
MLRLDAPTVLILMLLGMDYFMFFSGLSKAFFVFKRKRSHIFMLIVGGMVATLVEVTASYAWLYLDTGSYEVFLGFITCVSWHLMLQIPCWIYCLRIQSLVGYDYKMVRYARAAPFILGVAQLPSAISFVFAMFDYSLWPFFVITSAVTTIVACGVEITMYFVLLKRVNTMFQYRRTVKKQMAMELTMSMVLLIALDVSLVVVKLTGSSLRPLTLPSPVPQMDNALRPFSYFLRINIAIRFFDDLVEKVNNRPKTTESYARWFNSSNSEDNK